MIDRAEATGLGVSFVGHAGLIVLLALGLAMTRQTPPPEIVEVTFEQDTGPVSSAPATSEPPAPAVSEEQAPPQEASGAEAAVPAPEPEAQPVAEPQRAPVETADRRRPDVTRDAIPLQPRAQPQPRPAPVRVAEAAPPRRPPAPQPRPGAPARTPLDLGRLSRIIGRAPAEATGSAPQAGARLTGAQQQALAQQIGGLIRPCASRIVAPNGLARSISVVLRVTVNQQGVPTGHQLVSSAGTNDANESYVPGVVEGAMRAVRACAARIATLPADQYAAGWRTFTYRFRFP
jgi:hypothetical protein